MKTAFFNCSSGVAGDMILAACISAGVSAKELEANLKKNLRIKNWELNVKKVMKGHFSAHTVTVSGDRYFSSPFEMKNIIAKSRYPAQIKKTSLEILDALIKAESKVHAVEKKNVHFHELSSLDTIIDIVGSCVCMHLLNVGRVYCSEINIGRVSPAALEILKDNKIPVYSNNSQFELATPTGVSIMSVLAENFGKMPSMVIERSGFGAGTAEISKSPNLLRLLVSRSEISTVDGWGEDKVVLLETNIDDMDPRIYPFVTEKLFKNGALDVWLTQVLMKKGRPGILLSVLCRINEGSNLSKIVFEETTTIGIRYSFLDRFVLERYASKDNKISYVNSSKIKLKSEFEISRLKALKKHIPLKNVIL
jgi:pyridinium-3,5-bisthiocarboxylic acid mononucleotide nickel chelatase